MQNLPKERNDKIIQQGENMNLQDMLKEVHRYDENVVIAEFKNGAGVAYERSPKGILYATVPEVFDDRYHHKRETSRWDGKLFDGKKLLDSKDQFYGFSEHFPQIVRDFSEKSYKHQLEQKIQEQFGEIVEDLDINTFSDQEERDWKQIGLYLSAALLAPALAVTIPLLGAYMIATRNEYQGSGGIGVVMLGLAPIVFPAMAIAKMINPGTLQYNCIGNKNMITRENTNSLPALDFYYPKAEPQKFRSASIYFPNGDIGSPTGFVKLNHIEDHTSQKINKEKYAKARYFLNLNPDVSNEMNRLLEEHTAFPKVLKEFTSQLNKENQEALLKSIGFM